MARVVVVGAGLGGLAVAARLAAQGHAVTVCEQATSYGGKLGWYARDGYGFDTGPSLLTMPFVFRELFEATGGWPEGLEVVRLDPISQYRFADGTRLAAAASPAAFSAELDASLGPQAGEDWRALTVRTRRMWEASGGPFLSAPLENLALLALRRPRDLGVLAPWRTLRGLGRSYLRDPRLRLLLDRYATYTGSDPRRAPAALAVIAYVEQAYGGWYVRGGLRRLADAVHDRAVSLGVQVRLGADVRRVLLAGSRAAGVELADGELLPADVVVSDADATHLYGELVRPAPRAAARRLRAATPSLSGFVLLLGLRGRTPGLGHHTVLFPTDYDAEFDAIFGPSPRPVPDPTLYVAAPDDPAVRPDADSEAWFVLVNAPRQGPVDWDAPGIAAAYAEHLLDRLAARGLPVRERLRLCEWRSPADLARDTRAVGGAIYGTSSNGARSAFLRPANRSPVPGLFLVGGSAHPGGGLPLVALSAAIVARAVGSA